MKFLKEIFIGAIKGILSVFIAFIIIMLFFSLISALFSPSTNEEIVVEENTLLFIDDLNFAVENYAAKPSIVLSIL